MPDVVQAVAYHRDPLGVLLRARARYGPVFTLRFPLKDPLVFVAAPEALGELLRSDPDRAHAGKARRSVLPQASAASPFGGDAMAHEASRARMWPGFAPQRVVAIEPSIAQLACAHAARWPRHRPFRVLEAMRTLCTDITVGLVLGIDNPRRRPALVHAIRRMLNVPGNPPLPLPGGNDGPGGSAGRAGDALFARRAAPVRDLLLEELRTRRSTDRAGEDALEAMLRSEPPIDDAAIVDQLLIVLMAAQEPPAIALSNVIYELAGRPMVIERFRADPAAQRPIIAEVLRLRPSASAALRQLTEPMEVAGHVLPAGTAVACPSPLLHRDPIAFPDPDAFMADRFTRGTPDGGPYFPFGGGIRRCIGEALAEAQFRAVLPTVLDRWHFHRAWPREERMVVRATVLVPHRSALVRAVAA
ncbi:MAG TPA: cytochrome P450 [Solirubrobacteraceae bacterium]|nr:cytochrome P450 [Solirubrobacteraceae bacterium]